MVSVIHPSDDRGVFRARRPIFQIIDPRECCSRSGGVERLTHGIEGKAMVQLWIELSAPTDHSVYERV